MRRFLMTAAALGGVLAIAGCDREPAGQVAAIVGDEEVTLQEINAEIGSAQLPKGTNVKEIQRLALQRIVERKLLADAARDQELDKKPEFLIRQRQLMDTLLVQHLSEQAERSIRVPEGAALDKYIAAHPATFASREVLQLDQIRFPIPDDANKLRELEEDHSMDAVAIKLKNLGIEFQRGGAALDSAAVPQQMFAQLEALPAGEPFVIPQNGIVSVSAIVGRRPTPLAGAAARPVAVQMIRNENLNKILKQRLDAQKARVEVKYQKGFSAPKPDKPAGTATGAR